MENKKISRKLIEKIKHSETAIFIGAGATVCDLLTSHERMPLGIDVKKKLLEHYYNKIVGDSKELENVFCKDFDIPKDIDLTPEMALGQYY